MNNRHQCQKWVTLVEPRLKLIVEKDNQGGFVVISSARTVAILKGKMCSMQDF